MTTYLKLKSELKTLRSYGDVTEEARDFGLVIYSVNVNGQTIRLSGEPERNLVACIEVGQRYFRRVAQAIEAVQA